MFARQTACSGSATNCRTVRYDLLLARSFLCFITWSRWRNVLKGNLKGQHFSRILRYLMFLLVYIDIIRLLNSWDGQINCQHCWYPLTYRRDAVHNEQRVYAMASLPNRQTIVLSVCCTQCQKSLCGRQLLCYEVYPIANLWCLKFKGHSSKPNPNPDTNTKPSPNPKVKLNLRL